jgi:hypothetical protein
VEHAITGLFDEIAAKKLEPIRKPGAKQASVRGVIASPIQDGAGFWKIRPIPVKRANLVGDADGAPMFAEIFVAWINGQLLLIEVLQQLVERFIP